MYRHHFTGSTGPFPGSLISVDRSYSQAFLEHASAQEDPVDTGNTIQNSMQRDPLLYMSLTGGEVKARQIDVDLTISVFQEGSYQTYLLFSTDSSLKPSLQDMLSGINIGNALTYTQDVAPAMLYYVFALTVDGEGVQSKIVSDSFQTGDLYAFYPTNVTPGSNSGNIGQVRVLDVKPAPESVFQSLTGDDVKIHDPVYENMKLSFKLIDWPAETPGSAVWFANTFPGRLLFEISVPLNTQITSWVIRWFQPRFTPGIEIRKNGLTVYTDNHYNTGNQSPYLLTYNI